MKAGEKPKNHRIQWADSQDTAGCKQTFDGIPFQIIGGKILECQNGTDRYRVLKRKEAEKRMREDVSLPAVAQTGKSTTGHASISWQYTSTFLNGDGKQCLLPTTAVPISR